MDFYIGILVQITLFILMCECYNLLYGYTNMMFLGLVGLFAVGAYITGLLNLAGVNPWLCMVASMVGTGIIGFFIALPTVRFKGDFLAIVTLGFGEIIRSVILNWTGLTRGPLGLPGISRPSIFGINLDGEFRFFVFSLMIVSIAMLILYRLAHSPFGKILETIREDDIASRSLGKPVNRYRMQIIVITSFIAGLIGALNIYFIKFTEPSVYSLELLGLILLAVFAGGPGKYWGVVIAATITMIVRDAFLLLDIAPSVVGPLRWVVLGSILVAILIYNPNGLFGKKFMKKNY